MTVLAVTVLAAVRVPVLACVFAVEIVLPVVFEAPLDSRAEATTEAASEGSSEAVAESATVAGSAEAVTASAGKKGLLVPSERAGDLLERGERGGHVLRGDGFLHLGADVVDDDAEAILRGATVVGERPAVALGRDPAALDEPMQLVAVQWAVGRGGAVDDVEHAPVATTRVFAVESGGELGRHQAVGGLQPVTEGAGGVL